MLSDISYHVTVVVETNVRILSNIILIIKVLLIEETNLITKKIIVNEL